MLFSNTLMFGQKNFKNIKDPFVIPDQSKFNVSLVSSFNILEVFNSNQLLYNVRLSGVIWDPQEPFAIIEIFNQKKIVKVGTTFFNITVKRISKNSIALKRLSKEIILNVGKETTI
jgi:hypothetical protein